jgi:hypothetical protein
MKRIGRSGGRDGMSQDIVLILGVKASEIRQDEREEKIGGGEGPRIQYMKRVLL